MKISEFAQTADVHIETVRYYQRLGLIRLPESNGSYRQYHDEDLRDILFIKKAQSAGFSLAEIKQLQSLDAINDRLSILALSKTKEKVLKEKIEQLSEAMTFLDSLIAECSSSQEAPCPILTAFKSGTLT